MDDRLKDNLEKKVIPSLMQKDKDAVICIDGNEGSGKTTIALQIGKLVDPSLDLNRVVFDSDSFRDAIFKAKKGQCIIYDEAFTGLSSRSSLSGVNRVLISLMMQMRQKNLFVIIVLPTYFLLDKYVALFRTKVLIHVYECSGRRGYFKVYNRRLKKWLFLLGRQTYSYNQKKIITRFRGRFYGVFALGDEKTEEAYRKKKGKALEDTEKTPMSRGQVKYRDQRDTLIHVLRKELKLTYEKMANLLDEYDFGLSSKQLNYICVKFGDKDDLKVVFKEKKKVIKDKDEKVIDIQYEKEENEDKIEENISLDENNEENDDFDLENDESKG